jgi:hypothetical protein
MFGIKIKQKHKFRQRTASYWMQMLTAGEQEKQKWVV